MDMLSAPQIYGHFNAPLILHKKDLDLAGRCAALASHRVSEVLLHYRVKDGCCAACRPVVIRNGFSAKSVGFKFAKWDTQCQKKACLR